MIDFDALCIRFQLFVSDLCLDLYQLQFDLTCCGAFVMGERHESDFEKLDQD